MNIYLDESYNLQKSKGKMFISINGFAVLKEKALRKRWKQIRKPYTKFKKRIHATDSKFEGLRKDSIKLLGSHDLSILSAFQLTQEIPHKYYNKKGMKFDKIYLELVKLLLKKLSLEEYKNVKIIIDARKHKGGKLAEKKFKNELNNYLNSTLKKTDCTLKLTPSYMDVLLELADFISNTFYKEYHKDSKHVFKKLGFQFLQIKNPL